MPLTGSSGKNRLPLPSGVNRIVAVKNTVRQMSERSTTIFPESDATVRAPLRWRHGKTFGAAVGLLCLLLCGCSTFNRDWRYAATQPAAPTSVAGRWEGRWLSGANGHQGKLRCLMTRESDECYQARFRATYGGVFRFSYSVPLTLRAHDCGWEVNGEANLGKLAGGTYYYEGRITPTNFPSTYRSKYDHGSFELHRPE